MPATWSSPTPTYPVQDVCICVCKITTVLWRVIGCCGDRITNSKLFKLLLNNICIFFAVILADGSIICYIFRSNETYFFNFLACLLYKRLFLQNLSGHLTLWAILLCLTPVQISISTVSSLKQLHLIQRRISFLLFKFVRLFGIITLHMCHDL